MTYGDILSQRLLRNIALRTGAPYTTAKMRLAEFLFILVPCVRRKLLVLAFNRPYIISSCIISHSCTVLYRFSECLLSVCQSGPMSSARAAKSEMRGGKTAVSAMAKSSDEQHETSAGDDRSETDVSVRHVRRAKLQCCAAES